MKDFEEARPAKRDWKRECKELETLVAQQAAVIEQKNELIQSLMDNWIPNNAHSSIKKKNAALQPCPEVLNKVRADAVLKLYEVWTSTPSVPAFGVFVQNYAQHVKQGEA